MDEHVVTLVEPSHQWRCRPQESIAEGADRAQIGRTLLHGCRGGGCGICKVRVLRGQYMLRRHSLEANPQSEKEKDIVLACCAEPTSDLIIQLMRPR